jgi:hypothetical protein
MRQHRRFSGQQSGDAFIRKYMTWLGHHEFGLDHRPFRFPEAGAHSQHNPDKIEYWIQRWIEAYGFLLGQVKRQEVDCLFFSYESLCDEPGRVLQGLSRITAVKQLGDMKISLQKSVEQDIMIGDCEQLQIAREIYRELSAQSESKLHPM